MHCVANNFKVVIVFIIAVAIGCKANQDKSDCNSLRDSLAALIQQGTLNNDTVMLKNAIAISDSLLSVDTTSVNRIFCYHHRSIIFSSLGQVDEAKKNFELEMMCLPEDNLERLLFMAVKNIQEQKRDLADPYLAKLLSICELAQQKEFSEDFTMYTIKALYLRDGEEKAKEYLHQQLTKHPNSQILHYMKDNWKSFTNYTYGSASQFD